MVGAPTEEQSVMTTIGVALTLQSTLTTSGMLAATGKSRETPTFLYQARGDIPAVSIAPEYGPMGYLLLELDPTTGTIRAISPFGRVNPPTIFIACPAKLAIPNSRRRTSRR
jgi:hypothetical protein